MLPFTCDTHCFCGVDGLQVALCDIMVKAHMWQYRLISFPTFVAVTVLPVLTVSGVSRFHVMQKD